jgi:hypothetical protein
VIEFDKQLWWAGSDNESYLVLVGRLEGKPYEIFCVLSQHVEVPKKLKTGTLIKNGRTASQRICSCNFVKSFFYKRHYIQLRRFWPKKFCGNFFTIIFY